MSTNTSRIAHSLKSPKNTLLSSLMGKLWCLCRFSLVFALLGGGIWLLILSLHHLLLPYQPLIRFYSRPPALFSLLGLLLVNFYICLLVHECGHALSARFLRYRLLSFVAGPLEIKRMRHRYRFGWHKSAKLLEGYVSVLPLDTYRLRQREFLIVAGGPLANLLQGMVCLACLSGFAPSLSFFLIWFLRFTLGIAFLFFVVNCVPLTACDGSCSDGATMLFLMRRGPALKRWEAIQQLWVSLIEGQLPAEWEPDLIQRATSLPDGSLDDLQGCAFAYCEALEKGDITRARDFLERRLARRWKISASQRRWLALEAAYFEARYHQNAEAARTWFTQAKNEGKGRSARFRAEAALFLAEKNKEGAHIALEKGLQATDEIVILGSARLEKRWLQDLTDPLPA